MTEINSRRWKTPDGLTLVEGPRRSTDFEGEPIPGLDWSSDFELLDCDGNVLDSFLAVNDQLEKYCDRYGLTRFTVLNDELVKFNAYCYQDSTYEIPHVSSLKQETLIKGLKQIEYDN